MGEIVMPQITICVCVHRVPHRGYNRSNWALLTIARRSNCNLTYPFRVYAQMWLTLSLGCYRWPEEKLGWRKKRRKGKENHKKGASWTHKEDMSKWVSISKVNCDESKIWFPFLQCPLRWYFSIDFFDLFGNLIITLALFHSIWYFYT